MLTHDKLFRRLRFYAIYDAAFELPPTRWLDLVLSAGFGTVQVRDKARVLDPRIVELMARRCRRAEVLFIVNDHVDLAVASGADGVHLGADDRPVAEVREAFRGWVIGRSARDEATAVQAFREGADYLGTGPVFATTGKENLPPPIGWEGVRRVADSCPLPVVAIGGLEPHRLAPEEPFQYAAGVAFKGALATVEGIAAVRRWIEQNR